MLQGSLGRTKPDWRLVRQGSASPVISDKRLADRKRFLPPGARRGSINIQHCSIMPDVGLTTAQEPLPADVKVIIKYSVEVGGLPVYQETYDVDKLAAELAADRRPVPSLRFPAKNGFFKFSVVRIQPLESLEVFLELGNGACAEQCGSNRRQP
jgi:hypothetical protein